MAIYKPDELKKCARCGEELPRSDFVPSSRKEGTDLRYPAAYCRPCAAVKSQKYRSENRESTNASRRRSNRRKKIAALHRYGGKCRCCGEEQWPFLTFQHINADGGKERRSNGYIRGAEWYNELLNNPVRDDIEVLCWNCHASEDYFGFCPHNGYPEDLEIGIRFEREGSTTIP